LGWCILRLRDDTKYRIYLFDAHKRSNEAINIRLNYRAPAAYLRCPPEDAMSSIGMKDLELACKHVNREFQYLLTVASDSAYYHLGS
jgi:hypothetical protein